MDRKFLTFQEIADITGYQRATISYWFKKGQFKKGTVFKKGNMIVVNKKEAERIIKEKSTPVPIN